MAKAKNILDVFVSHISEESALATIFKDRIEETFGSRVNVFVSSFKREYERDIDLGDEWFKVMLAGLKSSKIVLVLCSSSSVHRHWVNFELGTVWFRGGVEAIPICHTDMTLNEIPLPISSLQGISASDPDGLKSLMGRVAKKLGSKPPEVDYESWVEEVDKFEEEYGYLSYVREAFEGMQEAFGGTGVWAAFCEGMLRTQGRRGLISKLTLIQFEKLRPHLEYLVQENVVTYTAGTSAEIVTGARDYTFLPGSNYGSDEEGVLRKLS